MKKTICGTEKRKIPLEQRAHFYTPLTGVCALCETQQPGHLNVRAVLRHFVPTRGCTPCDACASIPAHFAAETIC